MGRINIRRAVIAYIIAMVLAILLVIRYEYFDVYLLSLNGRIEEIKTDIKQTMSITIADKEYDLEHYWPLLQKKIEIGDSVYKQAGAYDIILIKRQDGEKITCHKD